jgi:AcrR family transcriptional regulator
VATPSKRLDASLAQPTRLRLIEAAAAEFNEHGFAGTDSNRIARRAGFAPQTFYRWFKDKTDIFIAVYRNWEDVEREVLGALLKRNAPTKQLVDAAVAHHRKYLVFRRSLRQLSLDEPIVRRVRAESRKRQIAQIRAWRPQTYDDDGQLAATLLQTERLADALAEDELQDMGLKPHAARQALSELIDKLRPNG